MQLLAPAATLALYSLDSERRGSDSFDPQKAFTAFAIISLVITPANMLLGVYPQFHSVYGNSIRIQNYLLEPSREDKRILMANRKNTRSSENGTTNGHSLNGEAPTSNDLAVAIDNVSLRPAASASTCLSGVDIKMLQGSLNVICGAVGTGKTTLARAILGDVVPDEGSVSVSTKKIGYCAQKPWITNASIKQIICGPVEDKDIDQEWYNTVVRACGLEEDLRQIPGADSEPVGSRGATLSGGQRQRVVSCCPGSMLTPRASQN